MNVDDPVPAGQPDDAAPAGLVPPAPGGRRDRGAPPGPVAPTPGDHADPAVAAVFRAFFVDGRLQTMPVKRSKRLIVLDYLARVFEPGVRYPETDVNAILRAFHPDYAMVRRYLVDEQFLARDHGVYWRIGGSVDV